MKYGCFDRRPHVRIIAVQDGWYMDGHSRTPKMVPAPVRGAPECQYTHSELGQADARCRGCTWRHNEFTQSPDQPQEK